MAAGITPTLSIVVPSYNQAAWIRDCLNSILNQKAPGDQLIVVDGGSDDGTQAILEAYAHRIDHLIIEPDSGQAEALAKGFAHATGDLCAYLNTDDFLLPDAVSFAKRYLAMHRRVDALYGHRIFVDSDNRLKGFWIIPFHSDYCMQRWDYIPQETCFWRRSAMEAVGGIEPGYRFAVDYDLFVRMMRVGRFRRVNRFLACFRDQPRSKTNTQYATIGKQEVARIQETYGLRFRGYDRVIGNAYGQLVLKGGVFYRWLTLPFGRAAIARTIARATVDR